MRISSTILCCLFSVFLFAQPKAKPTLLSKTQGTELKEGFFDFYWNDDEGKVLLKIEKAQLNNDFLYVNSLAAGVGSNDIGLDRGQLGGTHVVYFEKVGNKILLTQRNLDYRAISDNEEERKSVEQAFAQSILWGFKVVATDDKAVLVDMTDFLLRDAHGVSESLASRKQGSYKLDQSRSAIFLSRCKSFPKNTELEATLTFTGKAKGSQIRSVTPSSSAVTVRQHHSFVELPDDKYEPRVFDPRCGFFVGTSFQDYATPITSPIKKRYIARHRLEKKDPSVAKSEAVEPIVYYIDSGAPEPVKSALIDGAKWWNQAFEAAGYLNAFQIKIMPVDADPMDVRYNLIQWVHRSTRGWSYGASVTDPRTGEIIKGHVSLGSLRVRQDFLIAQGLIAPYENGNTPDPRALAMALARLRQLSAHEIGHTLGLAHNFAASVNDRASVMDYPHPLALWEGEEADLQNAYDTKIGDWDKRTILYGYQDFPKGTNEQEALKNILQENINEGYHYISDEGARPQGGAHPLAHLWDNGKDITAELNRLIDVRAKAIQNFSTDNIPEGMPMAYLENVFVPIYLMHRYQAEGVAKVIGGVNYTYAVKGDGQVTNQVVNQYGQRSALAALLATLAPAQLEIPNRIIKMIPPQPMGYSRDRELFKNHTGLVFDRMAAAESYSNHVLSLLLNPERLARLQEQDTRGNNFSINEMLDLMYDAFKESKKMTPHQVALNQQNEKLLVINMLRVAGDARTSSSVKAVLEFKLKNRYRVGSDDFDSFNDPKWAHWFYLHHLVERYFENPSEFKLPTPKRMPDGSPIGCGHSH